MIEPGSDAFDSVYFFMWPGWSRELRSNRWHWAKRWARLKPVVLIQPDRLVAWSHVRPDLRIPNCHVLSIFASNPSRGAFARGPIQTVQIARHMVSAGHARPLFWVYNPYLLPAIAGLPAVCRVLHATENYFDSDPERSPVHLLPLYRTTVRACDVVVAVSEGVAEGIRREIPESRLEVVTNGCDFAEYSAFEPSPRLKRAAAGFEKIAIYAGNINFRLDFDLLLRCVERHPGTLFAFFGPVAGLAEEDRVSWSALRRNPNVRHFGAARVEEIPDLYGAADVGLIPYKRLPLVERNGFPLKALEMAATGLPVVSTYMKPLETVVGALSLERDAAAFVDRVGERSRGTLTESEATRMRDVCRAHDYDRKFEDVQRIVSATLHRPSLPLDTLASDGWERAFTRATAEVVLSRVQSLPSMGGQLLLGALDPLVSLLPGTVVRNLKRMPLARNVLSGLRRRVG